MENSPVKLETKLWGYPNVDNRKKLGEWYQYIESINSVKDRYLNIVFVDGRFRVACALKALLYVTNLCNQVRDHRQKSD